MMRYLGKFLRNVSIYTFTIFAENTNAVETVRYVRPLTARLLYQFLVYWPTLCCNKSMCGLHNLTKELCCGCDITLVLYHQRESGLERVLE